MERPAVTRPCFWRNDLGPESLGSQLRKLAPRKGTLPISSNQSFLSMSGNRRHFSVVSVIDLRRSKASEVAQVSKPAVSQASSLQNSRTSIGAEIQITFFTDDRYVTLDPILRQRPYECQLSVSCDGLPGGRQRRSLLQHLNLRPGSYNQRHRSLHKRPGLGRLERRAVGAYQLHPHAHAGGLKQPADYRLELSGANLRDLLQP